MLVQLTVVVVLIRAGVAVISGCERGVERKASGDGTCGKKHRRSACHEHAPVGAGLRGDLSQLSR